MGCENAEYKAQTNSLYITDAADIATAATITMDDGADINVVVRLAQKVTEDVEVEIQFVPELLTEYNTISGTEYEVLPANMLPQNATVTIPAGEISANYRLHVNDFCNEWYYLCYSPCIWEMLSKVMLRNQKLKANSFMYWLNL